ncbi:sodium/hydrogen exchanger 3-like isoform X2 [Mercenaria mercenaria]|nr:sodium/hydrogen exchanger 3-like isoform X2 [Mercenaria mercenaria]XP_053403682.1 sodium/hydrogen exchanger 3-like isoform X2 [Mercenaria mercenaria]
MPALLFTTTAALLTVLAVQNTYSAPATVTSQVTETRSINFTSTPKATTTNPTSEPTYSNKTSHTDPPSQSTEPTQRDSTQTILQTMTEATINPNKDSKQTDNITEEEESESEHEHPGVELIVVRWKDVEYPFIITLVVIFIGLSKLGFHYSHFLSSKVPESCVLIVLGVISGVILYYTGITKDVKLYAPHLFFLYLLPSIILEAAYGLYDRTFADNIGGVLLFAVLGTVLNWFLIGLSMYGLYIAGAMEEVNTSLVQMLLFAALIVSTDPVTVLAVFQEVGVNDMLYFLVFGESLLNGLYCRIKPLLPVIISIDF